jgi:hypothetical protein
MGYQTLEAIERRRRNIRIILFVIILATLPFYCVGALLWGTAPRNVAAPTDFAPTFTPIGGDQTAVTSTLPVTTTPLFVTATSLSPLQPTPGQFTIPTRFITATSIFVPTSTLAPTLTLFPSVTPIPQPTSTPIPLPSNTPLPLPSDTPLPIPSDTPLPLPSDTPIPLPSDTPLPLPSDTPTPLPSETALPFPSNTPEGG